MPSASVFLDQPCVGHDEIASKRKSFKQRLPETIQMSGQQFNFDKTEIK
jgi:hypothetical protein